MPLTTAFLVATVVFDSPGMVRATQPASNVAASAADVNFTLIFISVPPYYNFHVCCLTKLSPLIASVVSHAIWNLCQPQEPHCRLHSRSGVSPLTPVCTRSNTLA